MRRSYNYEFNEESHSLHEQRTSWSTNYPSYDQKPYYAPPPTMHKMVHHPSSDDEDDHHHDHIAAINDVYDNSRWAHRDHDDGNYHGWCGTLQAINRADIKNKHQGPLLRPPSHQYHLPTAVVDQKREVRKNQDGWHRGEAVVASRNNNRNRAMEEYYPRRNPSYGEVSRFEDVDGHHHNVGSGIGGKLESLIKGLNGKVKKIEVIEYERTFYRGAREEWKVLGGNYYDAPTNYPTNSHFYGGYPKSHAPRVKGF